MTFLNLRDPGQSLIFPWRKRLGSRSGRCALNMRSQFDGIRGVSVVGIGGIITGMGSMSSFTEQMIDDNQTAALRKWRIR
jgi:hypothetical protein